MDENNEIVDVTETQKLLVEAVKRILERLPENSTIWDEVADVLWLNGYNLF